MAAAAQRRGGGGQIVSSPVLAYRVYPDGREELIRGLDFRGVSARTLRDIVAASDQPHVFHYILNSVPLSLMGAGGFVTACSVVSPSILIDDMEFDPNVEELPKMPIVPSPTLVAAQ